MSSWPKYQSHKVVQAAQIVGFDTRDTGGRVCAMVDPGTGVLETFTPTVPDMLEKAEVGGWAMLYPDGFRSISPAKQFEDGYVLMPE